MSDARIAAERRQGEQIAVGDLERVWGWSGAAGRIRADRRAAFIVGAARLQPGVRALELGCGTGEFTTRLVESGCDLVAIDISEASVERCRARVGERAEVLVGNVETGEGLDGREFDAIVGVSVLHHLDVRRTLAHTFARLVGGGRFAFSEPNRANPQVWLERRVPALRRLRHVLPHETAFTASGLQRLFEGAGLVVELAEPFEFLHPATPELAVSLVLGAERVLERTPLRAIAGSVGVAGRKPTL